MKTIINLTLITLLSIFLFISCNKEEIIEEQNNSEEYLTYKTPGDNTIVIPKSINMDQETLESILKSFDDTNESVVQNTRTNYYPINLGVTKSYSAAIGVTHCYTYFHTKSFDADVTLTVQNPYSSGGAYCSWFFKPKGTTTFYLEEQQYLGVGEVSYTKSLGAQEGTRYEKFRVCITPNLANYNSRFYYNVSCSF